MTDIELKRAWVGQMYPGKKWKREVSRMPDSQIVAIYMRENRVGDTEPHTEPKEESEEDGEIPF